MNNAIDQTTALYAKKGWKKFFSKARFWHAPFTEVEKLVPKNGTIVDLGCGEGIFSIFLGITSPKRTVIGIEKDPKRLADAYHDIKSVKFVQGDVTKVTIPPADAIILFHLLHHLNTYSDQEELLQKCVRSLRKGGKIIIVEIHVRNTLKYALSWIADHLLVAWFFEKRLYSPILFRKREEWTTLLEKQGLLCRTTVPKGTTKPFSNIIFECTKQSTS